MSGLHLGLVEDNPDDRQRKKAMGIPTLYRGFEGFFSLLRVR